MVFTGGLGRCCEVSGAVTDRLSGLGFGKGLFAVALAGGPPRPGVGEIDGKSENDGGLDPVEPVEEVESSLR